MVTIVCWNINKKSKPWNELLEMDADIALLQEVSLGDVPASVEVSPHTPWPTYGYDRWPMVVKLSDKVNVEWFKPVNSAQVVVAEDEIAMSDFYTIAAARVTPFSNQQPSGEPFIVFSMYARWLYPHPSAKQTAPRKKGAGRINIYSDASAHRIISDIAAFIGHTNPASHRILTAGDLNTIYDATEKNPLEMRKRMLTVFNRMNAIGLEFVGPRWPNADRQAYPPPQGLMEGTLNVSTFYTSKQGVPANAQNQLDYVFASKGFGQGICVHAMNDPARWGSSDHCRIWIEVQ